MKIVIRMIAIFEDHEGSEELIILTSFPGSLVSGQINEYRYHPHSDDSANKITSPTIIHAAVDSVANISERKKFRERRFKDRTSSFIVEHRRSMTICGKSF